jgi:hypothetical protein
MNWIELRGWRAIHGALNFGEERKNNAQGSLGGGRVF